MIENINWYPGHMKKTREMIQQNLKMVDLVIEVVDARIPVSSRNPIIDDIVSGKKRIIILNKSDLSDKKANDAWAEHFKKDGNLVVTMNCMAGGGVNQLLKVLEKEQDKKNAEKAVKKPLRMMIVGVPNVGKSSLINRLTGKRSAQVGDRPGVTRGKQWLTLKNGMQLLDTPGILWPKFEDPKTGINLAYCGSIKDEIMDIALEAGADDIVTEDGVVTVTTDPSAFETVLEEKKKKGYESVSAEVSMVPDTYSAIDKDTASKVQKLIDRLEEDDDVQNVYTNADFPEDFEG